MDKFLHVLVGIAIMFIIIGISPKFFKDIAGILTIVAIASIWEFIQEAFGTGRAEWEDILATCAIPILVWIYISKILK